MPCPQRSCPRLPSERRCVTGPQHLLSPSQGSPQSRISISCVSRATSMVDSAFPFVLAAQMVICCRVRTEESLATHKGEQMNELARGSKGLNLGSGVHRTPLGLLLNSFSRSYASLDLHIYAPAQDTPPGVGRFSTCRSDTLKSPV